MRFVCGEPSVEHQWRREGGGGGGRNKSFVCMRSRNCIIDIIIIIIILISCSGRDVSKLPGDGDFFWLVLV